jgi:Na+-transporting NADH:ubiquinone oxidoreductase subunit NqrB
VSPIVQWMGIVLIIGILLMVVEYRFAKKKKEGFVPADRQRIIGIFWLTIFFMAMVGAIVWFAD